MTAGDAHRLDCPFPLCEGWWYVGSGVWQIPYHHVRGGRVPAQLRIYKCPGALINFHFGTHEPLQHDKDVLIEQSRVYRARLAEWEAREAANVAEARAASTEPETPRLVPEGRPADLIETEGEVIYFPGRPADAPEPGPGEQPAQIIDFGNVAGHHQGRAAVDNAHNTARELAGLAVNQMGQTQDILARATAALDEALTLAVAAEQQVHSVGALVHAAVGSGNDVPESGRRMSEQTALAISTIGDPADGILPALQLAASRVQSAHEQVASAVEHGRNYIAAMS